MQPKDPNGAIFVNIEGYRPYLSKPSYGAPQYAPMVRLMQKERLKSPHQSPFYVTVPFWSFWSFFGKHAILVILASHFRTRMGLPKKSATCGLAKINVTEPHTAVAFSDPPLRRDKVRVEWGCNWRGGGAVSRVRSFLAAGSRPGRAHTPGRFFISRTRDLLLLNPRAEQELLRFHFPRGWHGGGWELICFMRGELCFARRR